MTREERAARREQRLKDEIDARHRELAQVQASNRAQARTQRDKRRYKVGMLADAAGLLAWEDVTLAGLFQLLARLRDCPDPVGVLDGLLAGEETTAPGTVTR